MQIEIFNQALDRAENNNLVDWCRRRPWRWGAHDYQGLQASGILSDLEDCEDRTALIERAQTLCPKLKDLELNRAWISMHMPGEQPPWHRNGAVWTVVFYLTLATEPRLGAGLEFLDYAGLETRTVLAQPGRMIVFNGDLMHRQHVYPDRECITAVLSFNRSTVQKGPPLKDH